MLFYREIQYFWQKECIALSLSPSQKLESLPALLAYHSGKIENGEVDYYTTRAIFENGKVENYTGSIEALYRQQNHKCCYCFLKEKIENKEPLTKQLINDIHCIITAGDVGEDMFAIQKNKENSRVPLGTSGITKTTQAELDELLAELQRYRGDNWLALATHFHAHFEKIYPATQSKGRVSRILLNYCLLTKGCPPTIIYEEDQKNYQECLRRSQIYHNLNPLVNFLAYETGKTWFEEWKKTQKGRQIYGE